MPMHHHPVARSVPSTRHHFANRSWHAFPPHLNLPSACDVLQAARDVLLQACLALQQRGAAASPALLDALHLVHSYLLVRVLVRQGDHLAAARLLLVVAVSGSGRGRADSQPWFGGQLRISLPTRAKLVT